jgi:bifunctional DNase/RNase
MEIQQACHPADAIAMAARTHVPLYATSRALKMGSWKSIQPWLETVKPQDFE